MKTFSAKVAEVKRDWYVVDADGKMATMKVNKANGTYFQNLTAYHESWHVFSQLFLTKSEKIALYTE